MQLFQETNSLDHEHYLARHSYTRPLELRVSRAKLTLGEASKAQNKFASILPYNPKTKVVG